MIAPSLEGVNWVYDIYLNEFVGHIFDSIFAALYISHERYHALKGVVSLHMDGAAFRLRFCIH